MVTFRDILGSNSYAVAAKEAEEKLRAKEPLVLHKDETIELAFKSARDPRDKSYLTSHRILLKDGKGVGHKRKNFRSIPYSAIDSWSVRTASGAMDSDCELLVHASAFGLGGLTYIDFKKADNTEAGVDIFAIQAFMNGKILPRYNLEYPLKGTSDELVVDSPELLVEAIQGHDKPSGILDFLDQDGQQCNAQEFEQKLKGQYPVLLPNEKVQLAFRTWRDFTVFTNQRIMIVDIQAYLLARGNQVTFTSVPWSCVRAYSVETAGSFLDNDTEMRIHTNIPSLLTIEKDFRKGKADIFAIKRCLNNKIIGYHDHDSSVTPSFGTDQKVGSLDPNVSLWGSDNNRPLDPAEMQRVFTSSPNILQPDEVVERAFTARRDIVLFTTRRVIKVDTKGFSGKRVEYTSIPWRSVIGFAVETAGGAMDNDAEVRLYTEMKVKGGDEPKPEMGMWELDFQKNLVDIVGMKKYLSQRCLKACDALANVMPIPPHKVSSQEEKGLDKLLSKLGDDQRVVDPTEMNTFLHTQVPILLDNETIVMAFKAVGKDFTFFTNLRLLIMDVKNRKKKVEYKSIPYQSIQAFSVESAGSFDRDSQVKLYTRNLWNMKTVSLDFCKAKADIILLNKFLSAVVLGTPEDAKQYLSSVSATSLAARATPGLGVQSFVSWMTSNTVEVENPETVTHQLRSNPPILLDGEQCQRAYQSGRDLLVYTNLRLIKIDVQGLTGQKVEYESIPMKHLQTFEVETAGHLDNDGEVYLLTDIPSKQRLQQDILVKKGDVMEMHKYLTNVVMFSSQPKKSSAGTAFEGKGSVASAVAFEAKQSVPIEEKKESDEVEV